MLVTVNFDDPMMFGNSLADEYQALVEVHKFTRTDIQALVLNKTPDSPGRSASSAGAISWSDKSIYRVSGGTLVAKCYGTLW